jgi:hypothetical protein
MLVPTFRTARSILTPALAAAVFCALFATGTACRSASHSQTGTTPAAPPRTSVRVLTIGNSFSDNATEYLPTLAEAGGKQLVLYKASLGGCSLERHVKLARAAQDDPQSAVGRPYGKEGAKYSLPEALVKNKWDDSKTGKFTVDDNHCNALGKYLGAAVWYEALFHDDVTRLTWAPAGIGVQDAAFLRRMAHRTVSEHLRPALTGSYPTEPRAQAVP